MMLEFELWPFDQESNFLTIDNVCMSSDTLYFYRFIPRHADELELDVDDPLFVEEEEDDYWYRGYNMRTGARGIFPAYYAHEVIGQTKDLMGKILD